jgi:hypothetical protein
MDENLQKALKEAGVDKEKDKERRVMLQLEIEKKYLFSWPMELRVGADDLKEEIYQDWYWRNIQTLKVFKGGELKTADGKDILLLSGIDTHLQPLKYSTRKPDVSFVPPSERVAAAHNVVLVVSLKPRHKRHFSQDAIAELVMMLWSLLHCQQNRRESM